MFRRSKPLMFLWVLAIALVAARMTDAHMHLCLDGTERAMSVHVEDAPTHHGEQDARSGHTDRDVDLSSPLLVKKSDSFDDDPLAVATVYVLALVLPASGSYEAAPEFVSPALPPVFDLRPPPRGPPA